MLVKIKVGSESAGKAVFSALKNHGATDADVFAEVMLEGKKFFLVLDVLIKRATLKTFLKTLPQDAIVQ